MNRTNRSIAALFILTALAVQPIATHAMAGRVAQAAKQGFNAAKQFASRHDLGDKAKTAAKTTALLSPVGYVIADPLHGGSEYGRHWYNDRWNSGYSPNSLGVAARAAVIGSIATTVTVAMKGVGYLAGARVELPKTKYIFLTNLIAAAIGCFPMNIPHTEYPELNPRLVDIAQRDYLRKNPEYMYPSKPGFNWDTWRRLHDQCVAHKDSSRK